MIKKLNMKSILKAAQDAECYNGNAIVDAFDYAAEKGYTAGVISSTWNDRIQEWRKFNPKAIQTLFERKDNYPGNYTKVPKSITNFFTKTELSKEEPSMTETMNLRTLLHKCYENNINNPSVVLDILQKMKDSGYIISDRDFDFAQGWKKFNENQFKKMVENTYNGTNGFAKRPLLDCVDFEQFIPNDMKNGKGKTLNVRTVVNKFYGTGCTDAIKILATLKDLESAGYEGVEDYNIPGLANKEANEVIELIQSAHDGTGYFEGMDILDIVF